MTDIEFIIKAAREHFANVTADIQNASTRVEHLRLTALAQEAENLVTSLEDFAFGLVYSHSITAREQLAVEELSSRE